MENLTNRKIAGIFSGLGALFLIYQKEYALAAVILATMVSYFAGEVNGVKKAQR